MKKNKLHSTLAMYEYSILQIYINYKFCLTFVKNSSIIVKVMPNLGKDEIYICLIKVVSGKIRIKIVTKRE